MNTAKIYHDSEGNECSIGQMIEREPYWAANRLQEGEKAIDMVEKLEKGLLEALDWNWLDNDAPEDVKQRLLDLIQGDELNGKDN